MYNAQASVIVMIDTHSHIYEPEFDEDRDLVVERAKEEGVTHILLPNCNMRTIEPMLQLCRKYPDYCYPMIGLHPTDVTQDYQIDLDKMYQLLTVEDNPYIAVGEVGLDFYWDASMKEQQLDAFRKQIEWARDLHLPLVIHARSAHRELVEVMSSYRNDGLTGIFHCFGGTLEEAQELLSFEGFALGIGGVFTYKKSGLPDVLRQIPLDRIVLETDAPYLSPVPHRGKRNESAYVACTMMKIAQELGLTPEQVETTTTNTAKKLFPRLK